ncbi:MAG: hypothetical protein RL701_4260, partial [Pseudomonadota bacterium]
QHDTRTRVQKSGRGQVSRETSAQLIAGAGTRTQRAQRVLELLCEKGSTTRGTLFALDGADLQLLAAVGNAVLPAELSELVGFARAYVARETTDETAYVMSATELPLGPALFSDHSGLLHRPVLLLDGRNLPVGVVMLASDKTPSAELRALAAELGAHIAP